MALPTRAGVRDAILRAVSGALSRTVLAIFGARSATALPTAGALSAIPVTRSPMRSVGRFDLFFAMSAGYAIRGRPCIPRRRRTLRDGDAAGWVPLRGAPDDDGLFGNRGPRDAVDGGHVVGGHQDAAGALQLHDRAVGLRGCSAAWARGAPIGELCDLATGETLQQCGHVPALLPLGRSGGASIDGIPDVARATTPGCSFRRRSPDAGPWWPGRDFG